MDDKPLANANRYLRRLERQRRAADATVLAPKPQPKTQRILEGMAKSRDARAQLVATIERRVAFIASTAGAATLTRLLGTLELIESRLDRQRSTKGETP